MPSAPTVRSSYGWAYDAGRQRLVMFGGFDDSLGTIAETWELY